MSSNFQSVINNGTNHFSRPTNNLVSMNTTPGFTSSNLLQLSNLSQQSNALPIYIIDNQQYIQVDGSLVPISSIKATNSSPINARQHQQQQHVQQQHIQQQQHVQQQHYNNTTIMTPFNETQQLSTTSTLTPHIPSTPPDINDDISKHLEGISKHLEGILHLNIIEEDIDGSLLSSLDRNDLHRLGVKKLKDKILLQKKIEHLGSSANKYKSVNNSINDINNGSKSNTNNIHTNINNGDINQNINHSIGNINILNQLKDDTLGVKKLKDKILLQKKIEHLGSSANKYKSVNNSINDINNGSKSNTNNIHTNINNGGAQNISNDVIQTIGDINQNINHSIGNINILNQLKDDTLGVKKLK
eukprot:45835_1